MPRLLSIDPGKSTGWCIGEYSDTKPWTLLDRGEVLDGLEGFTHWWQKMRPDTHELLVERFVLDPSNQFVADLTPKQIEGALYVLWGQRAPITWQLRSDKAALCGYPPSAKTKAQRQRVRFDWLRERGLYLPGTQHDDSNDAITHSIVRMKRLNHMPTLRHYWGSLGQSRLAA